MASKDEGDRRKDGFTREVSRQAYGRDKQFEGGNHLPVEVARESGQKALRSERTA